jgi:hypothetical protein
VRFGTAMQTASRLPAAAAALGGHPVADATAVRVLEHVLRYGRDARTGAIRIAGPAAEPLTLAGSTMLVRAHPWWVQLEALRALHFHYRRTGRWREELTMLWSYIRGRIFDERHGGTYTSSIDSLPWWRPRWPLPPGITRKGDVWKDASHEGRVLLMLLTAQR